MNRRDFIKFAGAASFAATISNNTAYGQSPGETDATADTDTDAATIAKADPDFSFDWLQSQAETLSKNHFSLPELHLPNELSNLNRKQYDAIRFRPDATLWKDDAGPFSLRMFHSGFQYRTPVEIYLIENKRSRKIEYSPELFDFHTPLTRPKADAPGGFSGIAVQAPIHKPATDETFLTFQGASFFRAIASGQAFGTIARAISINTAQSTGEEFPFFRALWIEKPASDAHQITVYGLLDGPSLTGAYRFTARPGQTTAIDVQCSIFTRKKLNHVGIAPLNSMYFFGAADTTRMNDYRPNVHSADGLQIWNAGGEWIWRPLTNPDTLQYSVFLDRTPKGFGLLQRQRDFGAYEDIDARFEDRPNLWVEPLGDWGAGAVDLIEVPSRSEIYDNVIAFWRPRAPLPAHTKHSFHYRLHWGETPPATSTLLHVQQTRIGRKGTEATRFFVLDFVSGHSCNGCNLTGLTADVRAGDGKVRAIAVEKNPATGGHRVTFEFRPDGNKQTDLSCYLKQNDQVVSETWVYRWTS